MPQGNSESQPLSCPSEAAAAGVSAGGSLLAPRARVLESCARSHEAESSAAARRGDSTGRLRLQEQSAVDRNERWDLRSRRARADGLRQGVPPPHHINQGQRSQSLKMPNVEGKPPQGQGHPSTAHLRRCRDALRLACLLRRDLLPA